MRFVPPLTLFAKGPVRFDGDEQAYARPMGPVLEGMRQLGARIEFEGEEGHLPFTVTPPVQLGNLKGKPQKVRIDSSASSQFISGLLLIGSRLPDGLILEHTGVQLPSMPHIRMTMEDVDAAGGHIEMPQRGRWIVHHAELQMAAHVVVERPIECSTIPGCGIDRIRLGAYSELAGTHHAARWFPAAHSASVRCLHHFGG